jgi:hypothetical protein
MNWVIVLLIAHFEWQYIITKSIYLRVLACINHTFNITSRRQLLFAAHLVVRMPKSILKTNSEM